MPIEQIIFWILLIDSLVANIIVFSGQGKKFMQYRFLRRYLPLTAGWTILYLLLVLYIGYLSF